MPQQNQSFQSYNYIPLDISPPAIRLLSILPGTFDDSLCIEIDHVAFDPAGLKRDDEDNESESLCDNFPKQYRRFLPDGWGVAKTMDGRFLFSSTQVSEEQILRTTSWDLPATPELAEQL